MNDEIYTIGYSSFSLAEFLVILRECNITAVADVRSQPYSRFKPEFKRKNLEEELRRHDIAYVFLGRECGARVDDPECFADGRVSFDRVARRPKFQKGLKRIEEGMQKHIIVLMCAEKDPLTCHRTLLICRNLQPENLKIRHILGDGRIERHEESEQRLLKMHDLDHPDIAGPKEGNSETARRR